MLYRNVYTVDIYSTGLYVHCWQSHTLYMGWSKIFRTDAVKIVKLTIRHIGRRHPWISSFPHVDTGPTILEHFLEVLFCQSVKHSLWFGLDLLNGIKPASFQLQFQFRKEEEVTGCQIRGVRWVGKRAILFFARKWLVRTEVWDGALS